MGAIIPYDYVVQPERLGEYTSSLIQNELIEQVMPGAYIYSIPDFDGAFIKYLEGSGDQLSQRRHSFAEGRYTRIHAEKIDLISNYLIDARLAREDGNYPWYVVEENTASDFMGYLAAVLGRHSDLSYLPVTDSERNLSPFTNASSASRANELVKGLRIDVISDVLPAPSLPLSAHEIKGFKERHGDKLSAFRREIEGKLIEIADIQNDDLRLERLRLFKESTVDEVRSIQDAFESSGMNSILGRFCSVVAAIPGISPFVGLATAVYNAFSPASASYDTSPFLYAAYAQSELASR